MSGKSFQQVRGIAKPTIDSGDLSGAERAALSTGRASDILAASGEDPAVLEEVSGR